MYIVICDDHNPDRLPTRSKTYIHEVDTDLSSLELEWDILQGQFDNPRQVIFVNPSAGICTDVSAEMSGWIIRRAMANDYVLPRDVVEFCEYHGAHVPTRLVAA